MHGNRRQERSGKFLELGGADAVDLGEFIYMRGRRAAMSSSVRSEKIR